MENCRHQVKNTHLYHAQKSMYDHNYNYEDQTSNRFGNLEGKMKQRINNVKGCVFETNEKQIIFLKEIKRKRKIIKKKKKEKNYKEYLE